MRHVKCEFQHIFESAENVVQKYYSKVRAIFTKVMKSKTQ